MRALFSVCALLSAAGFCLPRTEKNASLCKQISLALGVILLVFALRPLAALPALFSEFPSSLSQKDAAVDYKPLDAVGEEAFCLGIRETIAERFSLSEEEIFVSTVGFSFESLSAERIRVLLSGKAARADLPAIRSFVNNTFGECEVEIRL